jgi:hypothetical protein
MTRRIALHRELPAALRFPGALWADMQTILLGAANSTLFPGQTWGGMSADTSIFVQNALAAANFDFEAAAPGQWRIFSKLGAGYSTSRNRGEIVSNAYACLPVLVPHLRSTLGRGLEFTVSVRGSVPLDSDLQEVETHVKEAVNTVVKYLLSISTEISPGQ